jgi:histone-lysine N-methyltransferase SETD3
VEEINPEFRKVVAVNRINKNELVLSIPRACIMTTSDAKNSAMGKELVAAKCQLGHVHSWLAVYLLQERRNSGSFYAPYINSLPRTYSNVPLFYTPSEIAELKGCLVVDMISFILRSIKADYDLLQKTLSDFPFTLKDFIWARVAVISRLFSMPAIKEEGLVPLADMLNHKPTASTTWEYSDATATFDIRSINLQFKGLEIFDSYGSKCNTRYFVNYGFTLPDNPDNQAAVFIKAPTNLTPLQLSLVGSPCSYDDGYSFYQLSVLRQLESKVRVDGLYRFQLRCPGANTPSCKQVDRLGVAHCTVACLRFLRVVLADAEEHKQLATYAPINQYPLACLDIPPLSVRNELQVISELSAVVKQRLSEFSTVIEADLAALSTAIPFSNHHNLLMIRYSEKKVLHDILDFCAIILQATGTVHQVAKQLSQQPLTSTYAKDHWRKLIPLT